MGERGGPPSGPWAQLDDPNPDLDRDPDLDPDHNLDPDHDPDRDTDLDLYIDPHLPQFLDFCPQR